MRNSDQLPREANAPTISVAMATYRGERYVEEQLNSICTQSIKPLEVVIFDDASPDNTFQVLEKLSNNTSVPTQLFRHPKNVGIVKNFEAAVAATKGELIVLADQDDIWLPHKLEAIGNAFQQNPAVGLVFSNANLVNTDGSSLKQTLWQAVRFTAQERGAIESPGAFPLLLRRFLVTGATLAFRREHVQMLLPFSAHLIHDAWIALLISAVAPIRTIEEPLINYRQHPSQQIGEQGKWNNWITQFRTAARMKPDYLQRQQLFFTDLANRLEQYSDKWVSPSLGTLAEAKVAHLARRIKLREQRPLAIFDIAKELISGNYGRFSYGWKSAAQDLLL
jgi:glycosyltransferase involved in cell wall biosynthesis